MQQQLEALELAFKQVLDQLELAANHNIKVMSSKSQECKDLLPIIDQKILHVTDLMAEASEIHRELPVGVKGLHQEVATGVKLRRDLQDLLGCIDDRISALRELQAGCDERHRELSRLLANAATVNVAVDKIVPFKMRDEAPVTTNTMTGAMAAMTRAAGVPSVPTPPVMASVNMTPRSLAAVSVPSTPAPSPMAAPPAIDIDLPIDLPDDDTHHRKVLDLHAQGVTSPQIANQLKMPRGEVQLILQLYGQTAHLRRVNG